MEVIGGQIFVIGDDSAWLFILNRECELIRKIRLYEPASEASARIPKLLKADLEALAAFPYHGGTQLLAIGSGSAQYRDTGFRIETEGAFRVYPYDLSGLYGLFRRHPQIVGSRKLNLEGLAVSEDTIFFMQRGNVSGMNALVSLALPEFFNCLESGTPPTIAVKNYQLPDIQGLLAGFSGLAVLDSQRLLFTATVENTADEIADGESLGSFAGVIDLQKPAGRLDFAPIIAADQLYGGKVESIAVLEMLSENSLRAVAVTDSDGGVSELLVLEMEW